MSNCYASYDEYGFRHLPQHLIRSGRDEKLREMLMEFDWLQAKLEATDANALIGDFDLAGDDGDLRLVQGALRLSAHVLVGDKTQFAGQLVGRLLSFQEPAIKVLLTQVQQWRGAAWLRPLTAMTPPGGPLLRTLQGHAWVVTAVAVTPDGRQAVSASEDLTLKVWDLESGAELRTFVGHGDMVYAVAVTPNGRQVVELRPESWTQKRRFLNNIGGCLLGKPLRFEFSRGEIAE